MKNKILEFIEEINRFSKYYTNIGGEYSIHTLFTSGYCYHFALILQSLFPGGSIKVLFGYVNGKEVPTHCLYEYDSNYYDYEGTKNISHCKIIDFEELDENTKNDFKHIWDLKKEESSKKSKSKWL